MSGKRVGDIILILLSLEIFIPRITAGVDFFTLDDLIPLIFGGLGIIVLFRSGKIPNRFPFIILALWGSIGFLSAIQNSSASGTEFIASVSRGTLRPFNSLLILILIFTLLKNNPNRLKLCIQWIVGVGIVLGVFAIVSYSLSMISGHAIYGIKQWVGGSAVLRLVPGRFIGSTNTAANFMGAFFMMNIPLTLSLGLTTTNKKKRIVYSIGMLAEFFGLIVTFTRASLIWLLVMLFWMLILLKKKRLIKIYVGIGSMVALILFLGVPEYLLRYTLDSPGRENYWTIGLRMMLDNPVLGVGSGRFLDVVALHPDKYPTRLNPHNAFIMLGAEGGIPLFIIGIALVIFILFEMYRAFSRSHSTHGRIILAGILAGGTGFIMQNITNDLLYLPHLTTYFWLFYALAMNAPDDLEFSERSPDHFHRRSSQSQITRLME